MVERSVVPVRFEREQMEALGLLPEIQPRYRSAYFKHIFSGGYASWYNCYVISDVMATDGFIPFEENGIYDPGVAEKLRRIYESGFTVPPMELYEDYMGRAPRIDALLRHRGLDQDSPAQATT